MFTACPVEGVFSEE